MLPKFHYLDSSTLDSYLSTLEGGLTEKVSRTNGRTGGVGGRAGSRGIGVEGKRDSHQSETSEIVDTPAARFERLLRCCEADPESAGWIELTTLADLAEAGHGALVSAECELYVPDAVRMFSPTGEAATAIAAMKDFMPLAGEFGIDMEGVPKPDQLDAFSSLLGKMSSDLVVVGEDESEWKVAARLRADNVEDDSIDGYFRIVGKVATRWSENRWKPLLALPGAGLLPRRERKALEAKAPDSEDDDSFLRGPAVMLDVLAIYR
jgi:hypothetical protein